MEGAKASSSRVRLIFVVLLVGAFAGANCTVTVTNFSPQPLQVYDVTTPIEGVVPSNRSVLIQVNPLPQLQSPNPETVIVFTFITAPNATQNVTGVHEPSPFLIAYAYDNATITISESSTTNKLGFSITYAA